MTPDRKYNDIWNKGVASVFNNNIAPPRETCPVCSMRRVVTRNDGTKWCLYCRAVVDLDV